jgi:LysM repeat protein
VKPDPRPLEEDPFGETPVVTPPTNPTTNPPVTTPENNPVRPVYHTVQKGDTLWNISQRYNTTVDAVQKLNNMDSINIKLGQQLRVQ